MDYARICAILFCTIVLNAALLGQFGLCRSTVRVLFVSMSISQAYCVIVFVGCFYIVAPQSCESCVHGTCQLSQNDGGDVMSCQ